MGVSSRQNKLTAIRRNEIIDAAEEVFFTKGFNNATMDDIARKAEYTKRTIYTYFDSKEQLYQAIIYRGFKILNQLNIVALEKTTDLNGFQKLKVLAESYLQYIQEFPHYFLTINNHQFSIEEIQTENSCFEEGEIAIKQLIDILKEGVGDGSIQSGIDIYGTAFILYAQMMGFGNLLINKEKYYTEVHQQTKTGLVEELFRFLERSLKAERKGDNHEA